MLIPDPTMEPRWPSRLGELCRALGSDLEPMARQQAREETWILLNTALRRYLRFHAARLGRVSHEDIEDISAGKALDLMRKAEEHKWDVTAREGAEISGYLSSVARNGLVDHLRQRSLFDHALDRDLVSWSRGRESGLSPSADPPTLTSERREFVETLRSCAGHLTQRARTIWFFRVFYEMSSKEIAEHPEVRLKPSHVDVILQRTRDAIRECVSAHGFEPHDMPPGCFFELWEAFSLGTAAERTPND